MLIYKYDFEMNDVCIFTDYGFFKEGKGVDVISRFSKSLDFFVEKQYQT